MEDLEKRIPQGGGWGGRTAPPRRRVIAEPAQIETGQEPHSEVPVVQPRPPIRPGRAPGPELKKIQVYVTRDLYKALVAKQRRMRRNDVEPSLSELVRQALDAYLAPTKRT